MAWLRSLVGLAAVAVLVAGCGGPAQTPTPSPTSASGSSASASVGDAVFQVVKVDGSSVPFSLAALGKLPVTSIMSDAQPQEGPTLAVVLESAGVASYGSITVTGASGSKTLTRAEVTSDVILDFNNRGSVKLVSPAWAKADRITDVTRIEVKA